MDQKRYNALMREESDLTPEELAQGWHFCFDWDGLLICPSDPEAECCLCREENDANA